MLKESIDSWKSRDISSQTVFERGRGCAGALKGRRRSGGGHRAQPAQQRACASHLLFFADKLEIFEYFLQSKKNVSKRLGRSGGC